MRYVRYIIDGLALEANFIFGSPNIATAIGPIIGGALAEFSGWRWIFWLLSILSGTCLLLIALFLPETARSVVGNGSTVASGLHRAIVSYIPALRPSLAQDTQNRTESCVTVPPQHATRVSFHIPNPAQCLRLLWAKDCILIVLIFGTFYMNLSCVQACTSALFINLYGLSELQAGLIYLASGIGSIIGAYGAGENAGLPLSRPNCGLCLIFSCFVENPMVKSITDSSD